MNRQRMSLCLVWILCSSGCSADATRPTSQPSTSTTSAPSLVATASAAAPPAPTLTPARGQEIGLVFEAFLSPHQEGDEEANTPKTTPEKFRATTPSKTRTEREAAGHRAHGQIRFTNDLSRAFIDVAIEGIDPKQINMFHIHCGKPGILGPILLDFARTTDLAADLADRSLSVEVRNEHIVATSGHAHGVIDAFTLGCVIPSPSLGTMTPSKVSTVAGMAQLARDGELYFNLHTTGHTYFGDIRGQIHPAN